MEGFRSVFLHHFVMAKLATSSIRVKLGDLFEMCHIHNWAYATEKTTLEWIMN